MSKVTFTISIVKKGKGSYIARADELAITSARATTQRGAIKQLKNAVLIRFCKAAESGVLTDTLEDAGYSTDLIAFKNATLRPFPFNSGTGVVPLPRQLWVLNK